MAEATLLMIGGIYSVDRFIGLGIDQLGALYSDRGVAFRIFKNSVYMWDPFVGHQLTRSYACCMAFWMVCRTRHDWALWLSGRIFSSKKFCWMSVHIIKMNNQTELSSFSANTESRQTDRM